MQTLSRYLPHFTPDGGQRSAGRDGQGHRARSGAEALLQSAAQAAAPPPPTFTQEEVGLAVSQAVREAVTKARAELAASEAARQEDAERFEATLRDRLATARAEWAEAEGDRLAASMGEAFQVMETRICDVLGRILAPFASEAMRGRALDDARHAIAALISQPTLPDSPLPAITVRGPADLLAVLKDRLGDPEGVTFSPGPGAEIETTCADTLIETRLGAWVQRLAAAQAQVEEAGAHG
ncbi:hypothetical protein V5F44_08490 [Xanthobacter sp. V2C-8]|uniref:hypothetical protein n=1 Tax=Xanthobacter albus TaxID=3119929 RepID=UPI00372C9C39